MGKAFHSKAVSQQKGSKYLWGLYFPSHLEGRQAVDCCLRANFLQWRPNHYDSTGELSIFNCLKVLICREGINSGGSNKEGKLGSASQMNQIIFSSHHFHICDFPPSSQERHTLFSAIKERWLLGPESDVPGLFLEPHLPSPVHF